LAPSIYGAVYNLKSFCLQNSSAWMRELMDVRRKIDGVDIIANDNEVWFVQDERICWTTKQELWTGSLKLGKVLRDRGYRIHSERFPKKLRELVLMLSR
jgi:hypothetical protein